MERLGITIDLLNKIELNLLNKLKWDGELIAFRYLREARVLLADFQRERIREGEDNK